MTVRSDAVDEVSRWQLSYGSRWTPLMLSTALEEGPGAAAVLRAQDQAIVAVAENAATAQALAPLLTEAEHGRCSSGSRRPPGMDASSERRTSC
jgi:hypothetical protein